MMSKAAYNSASMKNQRALDKKASKKNFIEKYQSLPEVESTNKKSNKHFKSIKDQLNISSIPYALYQYRKELQRRRLHIIKLSQAKIILTDGLVIQTANNIHGFLDNGANGSNFKNDMDVMTREVIYKKKLQQRINRIEEYLRRQKEQQKNTKAKEIARQQETLAAVNNLLQNDEKK